MKNFGLSLLAWMLAMAFSEFEAAAHHKFDWHWAVGIACMMVGFEINASIVRLEERKKFLKALKEIGA